MSKRQSIATALVGYFTRGDTFMLESLLLSEEPLDAEDRKLILEVMTGKRKRPKGRPPLQHLGSKQTINNLPIHAAFFEVRRLRESAKANGEPLTVASATTIAAERYGVDEGKLATLLRRPKRQQPWTERSYRIKI